MPRKVFPISKPWPFHFPSFPQNPFLNPSSIKTLTSSSSHLMRSPSINLVSQSSHMASLRNALHRNLIHLTRSKLISNPPSSNRARRAFHSSNRLCNEESNGNEVEKSKVWAVYDPVSGEFVTTRTFNEGESKSRGENVMEEESAPSKRSENPRVVSDSGSRAEKSVSVRAAGGVGYVMKKKSGKTRVQWVCGDCGEPHSQWWGSCHSCHAVGTLKEFAESEKAGNNSRGFEISENATRSWLQQRAVELQPRRLTDVNKGINPLEWRIPLFGLFGIEVGRVLGGGLVPGSLVLVGGDPGVGKSTLLLQIAAMLAEGSNFSKPAPVIYVSGEESIEQIGNRADRMRIGTHELYLYSSTDVEDILEKIQGLSPRALVVDSIQTVYLKGVVGSAGNIQQVKECTSALLRFAKQTNIPVLLIGHVTKTGDIAGPRVLEHIVDVVLYMEGEKYSSYRLLRSVKNRFGSTDELGVFEMSQSGLKAVSNPSEIFLSEQYSDSEVLAGLAVAVIVDGSRSFLIEIQALCSSGSGSTVKKHFNGIRESRADMIISILMKQAGLKLQDSSIFLNVVSGINLKETAGDLAVAAAICSSFFEFPIPTDVAFIGEIGLGGELRTVPRMDKRVVTVSKLGYKRCIIPKSAEKLLTGLDLEEELQIVGCRNLKEVINGVFTLT